MMMIQERDWKLSELVLYVAMRSEGDEFFARTKLNKILFYVDLGAYVDLGHSVTGQDCVKQPAGPVPPV